MCHPVFDLHCQLYWAIVDSVITKIVFQGLIHKILNATHRALEDTVDQDQIAQNVPFSLC